MNKLRRLLPVLALLLCLIAAGARAETQKAPYLAAEKTGKKEYTFTFYYAETPRAAEDIACSAYFENVEADFDALYRVYGGKRRNFVIDPSFADYVPLNAQDLFAGADKVEGLESLNTARVANMRGMFRDSDTLTQIDCANFDTHSVTTMKDMFSGCELLETVYVGQNWTTEALDDPEEKVFSECEMLKGQWGSRFDGTSAAYAKLDKGSADKGYFSCKHSETTEKEKHQILYRGDRYTVRCSVCKLCGMVPEEITVKPEDEYKPVKLTIYALPTCRGKGLCRAKGEECVLDELDHDFSECEILYEATCLECGRAKGRCARCGIYVTVIRPLGHNWDRIRRLEPTCTEDGFTDCEICARCLVTRNQKPLAALGHDMQPAEEKAATCFEEGHNAHMACTRCDYAEGKTVYPVRSHDMGEWTLVREATCAQEGEWQRKCRYADCAYCESKPIEKTAHTVAFVTDSEATCTQDGRGHETCRVCGANLGGKVTVKATGHVAGNVEKTEATCTEKGVEKTYCAVCGKCIQTQTVSEALGHEKGEAVVVKEATCAQKGKKEIACKRCGKVLETETLPVTEHQIGEYTVTKKPTCGKKGTETGVCSVCGKKVKRDIAKTGHDWGKWEETKPSTANKKGKAARVCALCGKKETEAIPKTTSKKYDSFMKAHFEGYTPSQKQSEEESNG